MASYILSVKEPGDVPSRADVGGEVNKDARKKGREVKGQDEMCTHHRVPRALPCAKRSCGCRGGLGAGQPGAGVWGGGEVQC